MSQNLGHVKNFKNLSSFPVSSLNFCHRIFSRWQMTYEKSSQEVSPHFHAYFAALIDYFAPMFQLRISGLKKLDPLFRLELDNSVYCNDDLIKFYWLCIFAQFNWFIPFSAYRNWGTRWRESRVIHLCWIPFFSISIPFFSSSFPSYFFEAICVLAPSWLPLPFLLPYYCFLKGAKKI